MFLGRTLCTFALGSAVLSHVCPAQTCQSHSSSPPFARLATYPAGTNIFCCGNASGLGGFGCTTPPGFYTQSGTLQPGDYILQVGGLAGSNPSPPCNETVSLSALLTLGSPVSVTSANRDVSSSDGCNDTESDISTAPGDYSHIGSRSCWEPLGPNIFTPSMGAEHLSIGVTGPPTATTGWSVEGDAIGVAGSGAFTMGDVFSVSLPTSYNITCSTSQCVSMGNGCLGSTQFAPILPGSIDSLGNMSFTGAPTRHWFDPPLAHGYAFVSTGAARFSQILSFPDNVDADNTFIVRSGGHVLGTFHSGQGVNFVSLTGAPVTSFEIYGISPPVDDLSPGAFPIKLAFDQATADFTMTPIDMVTPLPYCLGDGTATSCPCGNQVPAGTISGCLNSGGSGGALQSSGVPSLLDDSLVLQGIGMPNSLSIFMQGLSQRNNGMGTVLGDGLLCLGGSLVRLGHHTAVGHATSFPASGDPAISVRGGITSPSTRTYQIWYRDSANFCTVAAYNLTNGLQVTWGL